MTGYEAYTAPPPLRGVPGFVEKTRELVEQTGGVTSVMAAVLEQAGVTTEIDGDTSAWGRSGQGALLIGDHRIGIEYVLLMATAGNTGREDMSFVAKPFSMQARIMGYIAANQVGLTLPVIPGTLARDRSNRLNRDLYWRIRQGDNLPTKQELKTLNAATLQDCSDRVANGRLVTIYPAGGVMDATKKPWQRGLGRVISLLPEEAHETTTIVPFRFDDFSRLALVRALHRWSRGKETEPQTIVLRLGKQGTPNELLGGKVDGLCPDVITETLRRQFVASFIDREQ